MRVSMKIANLNFDRYHQWKTPFTSDNARPAALTFKGDVYTGLGAGDFTRQDLNFAQKHLRILSGLYGLLRPLDLIQPYRLEMGTRLGTLRGDNLYQFWGNRITEGLCEALSGQKGSVLVNSGFPGVLQSSSSGRARCAGHHSGVQGAKRPPVPSHRIIC